MMRRSLRHWRLPLVILAGTALIACGLMKKAKDEAEKAGGFKVKDLKEDAAEIATWQSEAGWDPADPKFTNFKVPVHELHA